MMQGKNRLIKTISLVLLLPLLFSCKTTEELRAEQQSLNTKHDARKSRITDFLKNSDLSFIITYNTNYDLVGSYKRRGRERSIKFIEAKFNLIKNHILNQTNYQKKSESKSNTVAIAFSVNVSEKSNLFDSQCPMMSSYSAHVKVRASFNGVDKLNGLNASGENTQSVKKVCYGAWIEYYSYEFLLIDAILEASTLAFFEGHNKFIEIRNSEIQRKNKAKEEELKTIKSNSVTIETIKKSCEELGFKPKTEKFGDCVLKLAD